MTTAVESTRKRTRASHRASLPLKKQKTEGEIESISQSPEKEDTWSNKSTKRTKSASLGKPSPVMPAAPAAKLVATRVRFDSEEPPSRPLEIAATEQPVLAASETAEENVDSDDEAPEDVSASAAQKATKIAAAGIAQAVQQQQLKDKRTRQEQAARAKERAATSKKTLNAKNERERIKTETSQNVALMDGESDEEELPELLPEELLAQDFTRPPTPPPTARQQDAGEPKSRRIKLDATVPMDIQVGPVKVSVLEKVNKVLPPKASLRSKAVREGWLAGRRGKAGMAMERKQFGGGFVKR